MDRTRPLKRKTYLLNSLVAASISLLTACGGGGSNTPSPEPQAEPKSTSGNPFTVAETRSENSAGSLVQLQIVDLRTGAVARRIPLTTATFLGEYPSRSWNVIFGVMVDSDGVGYTVQGPSQLTYIQDGKVMALDLNADALGTPRQLTNIADACTINRDEVHLSPDGRRAWVRVTTQGPDRNCSNQADNLSVLASLDMTATDQAVASGLNSGREIISSLNDAAGLAQGLLVIDRDRAALAVYSNDLKTKLYNVPVPGFAVSGGDAARELIGSSVKARKSLIQLGTTVRMADWNGQTLTLTAPIINNLRSGAANSAKPVTTRDNDRYYLGDGTQGHAINTSGQLLATFSFPPERGDIIEAAITDLGVIVNQTIRSGTGTGPGTGTSTPTATVAAQSALLLPASVPTPPIVTPVAPPASTLWSFNKNTGTYFELTNSNSSAELAIESVFGNTVYFSRQSSPGNKYWRDIYKGDAQGGFGPFNMASGVYLLDHVRDPHIVAATHQVKQLLWCTAGNATQGCANGNLFSYDTSTDAQINLGTLTQASDVVAFNAFGLHESWSGRNSLIQMGVLKAQNSYSNTLWMLNPGTAASLKLVSTQP
ncbi:MAG: hypothetical protein HY836_14125 [Aquabacterium sp.]|uniref:hypothetical protein n=1 Tax=Aquabacterium sp. TaxID=1872578 RepID=UPI0025C2DC7F|nr:hypothetical protein [Aquabacterium sp.]MBI5926723.1 hypothetical protein [Aquabacterium sp.]